MDISSDTLFVDLYFMNEYYSGSYERLENIMRELRSNCPWDKKQTIHSLRKLTIEETYELVDAIDKEDWQGIKEELGDLLLHLIFYTRIAEEQKVFTREELIQTICKKLVSRHPHIYDSTKVENEEEVKQNWENLKLKEGKKGVLSGVPQSLPAIIKSLRIQEKAKQVGFEWEKASQVKEKIDEEWQELEEALSSKDQLAAELEFGDVLFSMINYARFLDIDPEAALEKTNQKFINRFNKMEKTALKSAISLKDLSLQELDAIWNDVKQYD
jgi:XTP/dITP diphosphohydrolase